MSDVVWKFALGEHLLVDGDATDRPVIPMPKDARVLCLQTQQGEPQLWARVDPAAPTEDRRFYVVGTGWDVPAEAATYVGTWQQGPFVFHLFAPATT